MRTYGTHIKSKSIVRFQKNGVRLTEDEIRDGVCRNLTAMIAGDKKEIETIEKAVTILDSDPYKDIVKYKYFEGKTEEEIAELMYCSTKTVRTHKSRLVARLSVFFYGAGAVS